MAMTVASHAKTPSGSGIRPTKELRQAFLDYFWRQDHLVLPSFSLIPSDQSTLFTSAGMQPLIPYFLGIAKPPQPRIATCQKCFRADDIDKVGYTWRHLSFFEMLGNFSFGDYFKREAIRFAWEFLTEVINLPKERLWVSVYEQDDEAFEIWHKDIGLPAERIVRLGKKDNWWGPVGDTGPCGPDTEIHYDRGEEFGCGRPDCKPGCDCDRWGELWNLVFQQYDQQKDGTLLPLPKPGIDTGMGLERLAAAVQGKVTVFETDIFFPLVQHICEIANYEYGSDPQKDIAVRIIADHTRAVCFMAAEGVVPSNEGRGYVMRRFIRRAMRLGRNFGIEDPFVHQLVPTVVQLMGDPYDELVKSQSVISEAIRREEERFEQTLEIGMARLEEMIAETKARGETVLRGRDAFTLYDTYGFPLELTKEICAEHGLTVDEEGFNEELELQRQRARERMRFTSPFEAGEFEGLPPTPFVGRMPEPDGVLACEATVIAIKQKDDEVWVVLDKTPFYPEGGGQIGDTGMIMWGEGRGTGDEEAAKAVARVLDTQKFGDVIAHKVVMEKGFLTEGAIVWAQVDAERRQAIRRAHTATHLLHAALRKILGEHVFQAGSVVEPDRLRFDFTHPKPLTPDELQAIEEEINRNILAAYPVEAFETTLQEAKAMGAMALFGEKYGEIVRVIRIDGVSAELCGGTHLSNTAEIGLLKIISETSVGANIRRIDAYTGERARRWYEERWQWLQQAAEALETSPDRVIAAINELHERIRELERKLQEAEEQRALQQVDELLKQVQEVAGVKVVTGIVSGVSPAALRRLADELEVRLRSGVIVLGTVDDGKVLLVSKVTKDIVAKGGHAGNLVREVAKLTDGGGGGRPDFAQAGGRNPAKLQDALRKVPELVAQQLKRSG
jgi:alanyl-tRNA synthetase